MTQKEKQTEARVWHRYWTWVLPAHMEKGRSINEPTPVQGTILFLTVVGMFVDLGRRSAEAGHFRSCPCKFLNLLGAALWS